MPRDGEKVRRRLQAAALELFQARGYEETTAAEIAEKAGVTERTFFRHFPDKRDALFGGEAEFMEALIRAVIEAPGELGPLDALLHGFRAVEPLFVENRPFTAPRQLVIARNPALRERAQAKGQALIAAAASALVRRGVPDRLAGLAAQVGMAALNHAVLSWFESGSDDLYSHVVQAFEAVRDLSAFVSRPAG